MAQDNSIETMQVDGEYQLSVQLVMHDTPVRCVVTNGDDCIISAGTKQEFIEWTRINTEKDDQVVQKKENKDKDKDKDKDIEMTTNTTKSDKDIVMSDKNQVEKEKEKSNLNSSSSSAAPKNCDFKGRAIFQPESVAVLHPLTFVMIRHKGYDNNLGEMYISGGSDERALIWNRNGELLQELKGHTNSVNSIDMTDDGLIVTGSFDGTAKIWKEGNCVAVLSGHKYGVEVCCLASGEIVTGSHKDLHFWNTNGQKIRDISFAHDHVIRKIKRHPLGFITGANDGYVKLWSNQGEPLLAILAHPEVGEKASFVYGLHACEDGTIISSGEDGTAKIWSANGTLIQVLRHVSAVWSVDTLLNGDIVTGCADQCVRVWSRDNSRKASAETIQAYYHMLEESLKAQMTAASAPIDENLLEDMSVLNEPGRPGQTKMVKDPTRGPSVYQWDAQENQWTYIGQITGKPSGSGGNNESVMTGPDAEGRPTINGVSYDYVTHVDINGDASIPLGFNRDDDPKEVARIWCTVHSIDLDQVPRIVEHLTPMADPVARAQRLERERIAASKQLKHIPSFRVCNYEINGKMQLQPMRERIEQLNRELREEKNEFAIDTGDKNNKYTKAFSVLFNDILADQKAWHVNEFPDIMCDLIINKLLQWPTKKVLPILDMIRVLMLHGDAVKKLGGDSNLRSAVIKHISSEDGQSDGNIQMIVCRLVCNYLAKRPRSDDERAGKEIPEDLVTFLQEILSNLAVAANNQKSTIHTAYIMLAHNVMLWYGKFKVAESDLYLVMTSALFELMSTQTLTDTIAYYSLTVIGTIAWASDTAKQEIQEVYEQQLKEIINKARNSTLASVQEISQDLWNLFEFK